MNAAQESCPNCGQPRCPCDVARGHLWAEVFAAATKEYESWPEWKKAEARSAFAGAQPERHCPKCGRLTYPVPCEGCRRDAAAQPEEEP